jgi:streptomycin 6-kinase
LRDVQGAGALRHTGGGLMLEPYLARWNLVPDGDVLETHSSRLLPVRVHGRPAMLKLAISTEEKNGSRLMTWWDGHGAAPVLEQEGDAILLERAEGARSLQHMSEGEGDDEATRAICAVIATLHAVGKRSPAGLQPLHLWFRGLERAAQMHGGIFSAAAQEARNLFTGDSGEYVVLHGDIHHGNILDFGARGWLAIDPKGMLGDRCFDYANLFCNPDFESAASPARFSRRLEIASSIADLDRQRLLRWICAWAALSAAWMIEDGETPATPLAILALAGAQLRQ